MSSEHLSTEDIWQRLGPRLKRFLLRRVGDEQTAEDLLQESFLRIHAQRDRVTDPRGLAAWVFRIARNLVIDEYRARRKSNEPLVDDPPAPAATTDNLNRQVAASLAEMIGQLPNGYRQAVHSHVYDGLSQQAVADQIGLSLSGTKSRIQRGRKQLQQRLNECCAVKSDSYGNILECVPRSPDQCTRCDELV